ncbi:MAG: M24 family metallopeptidase [Anaerolineae bacterium]
MLRTFELVPEKLDQAVKILKEKDIDLWLTFVRETTQVTDPSLALILGFNLTWQSALMISKSGERIAIVGHFDAENVRRIEGYDTVIGYHQSIREPLLEILERLDPQFIAINYSENDPSADGLTHGMFCLLFKHLADTPYATRLISAEDVVGDLRGRKSAGELKRIQQAIATTEQIFDELTAYLQPGQSERALATWVRQRVEELGLDFAWEPEYCPIFSAGPDSPYGHAMPGDWKTQRGQTLQIDFGVKENGFVADLQRTWYFLDQGESQPPEEVQQAFDAVRATIEAGKAALKPGAIGWEVDAIGRNTITQLGYPEYQHSLGHQVGRTAHDGSTLLGPRWERYGESVQGVVEKSNVFTLELGVYVPGRGYVGLEEDVLVTANGCEYLSKPQTELWCV